MKNVVIVDGFRTAIGKLSGGLKNIQPEILASNLIVETLSRCGVSGADLDEVILGHAKQSSDQPNIARLAALHANIPIEVPAYTVHRQCGSGMQAVQNAVQMIRADEGEMMLVGGVESMSTAPYYLRAARDGYKAGNGLLLDPNTESQPRSQPSKVYGELNMGVTAENLAMQYGISRLEQDEFAYASQRKTKTAMDSGRFAEEIVPVIIKSKKGTTEFKLDEHPRLTSLEALASLKTVFKQDGTVTAGNASGRNDGAAMLLVAAEDKALAMGLPIKARIIGQAAAGVSPDIMGIGPVPATRKALERAGLKLEDIGLFELNEAFAAQSIAVIKELGINPELVNVNGGAIALGHPIGCSGARIIVTLIHEMKKRKVRYGLATLCIAGGLGLATVVENYDFIK